MLVDSDPRIAGNGDATALSWFGHILSCPWKVIMALLPPGSLYGGYPCFVCAICVIGAITFLIDEVATMFGCCCSIPPSINAITFVALGTSLPDTLASRTAALHDDYADDSARAHTPTMRTHVPHRPRAHHANSA